MRGSACDGGAAAASKLSLSVAAALCCGGRCAADEADAACSVRRRLGAQCHMIKQSGVSKRALRMLFCAFCLESSDNFNDLLDPNLLFLLSNLCHSACAHDQTRSGHALPRSASSMPNGELPLVPTPNRRCMTSLTFTSLRENRVSQIKFDNWANIKNWVEKF
jgi:hypothetical protein